MSRKQKKRLGTILTVVAVIILILVLDIGLITNLLTAFKVRLPSLPARQSGFSNQPLITSAMCSERAALISASICGIPLLLR